jgi:lipopolysaccharide biosynthesis protein
MQDICFFAHFDQSDKVDEYVFRYLQKIKDLNFTIVFVSAASLGQPDIDRLRAYCFDVILRENAGLDFGSWSEGIAKHRDAITGRLLLANDSVYGPVGSLSSAVERLTARPADFYGMVESIEIAPHLQSWFLLFEPWVARHPVLQGIMAQPFASMTKAQIIMNGEVAISRRL